MKLHVHPTADDANAAAAGLLAGWLGEPEVRRLLVAAGNTPLALYARVAALRLPLAHLEVFALDEYVGVPPGHPRNCGNLLRRSVAQAWGVPAERFHAISPVASEALASVQAHERRIREGGGLDLAILGLGRNGHLAFNEPGSTADSEARLVPLEPVSITANRAWFQGEFAPDVGVTLGMRTLLAARRILLLAFGPEKAGAVAAMLEGPVSAACPASFLRSHPDLYVVLDRAARPGR